MKKLIEKIKKWFGIKPKQTQKPYGDPPGDRPKDPPRFP